MGPVWVLAVSWMALLTSLAASNRVAVTLNRQQILDADLIVTGFTETELSPYLVSQGTMWPVREKKIAIRNLPESPWRSREQMLFPLTRLPEGGVVMSGGAIPAMNVVDSRDRRLFSLTTSPFAVRAKYELTPIRSELGAAPQAYPMTPDVIRQLKQIRPEAMPPASPLPTRPVLRD